MKTMIPNQLKFDLDLQDLPARAREVGREDMLKMSGGCRVRYECLHRTSDGSLNVYGTVDVWWSGCGSEHGKWACNQKYSNHCYGWCYARDIADF